MKDIDIGILSNIIKESFQTYVTKFERINMGVMNFNYRFNIKNSDYILRISPLERFNSIKYEFVIMNALHEQNCKVPKPLLFSQAFGYNYLVYIPIEGNALSEFKSSSVITDALVKSIMNNINAMSLLKENFFTKNFLDDLYIKDWKKFLSKTLQEGRGYLIANTLYKEVDINRLHDLLQKILQNIEKPNMSMVWSDFSRDNIIIKNDNTLSGFIDFEGCLFGDPILALGYLFSIEGDSLFFKKMRSEYEKYYSFQENTIYFYSIFRIFRIAKYLNNPLPTGIARTPINQFFRGYRLAVSRLN